MKKRLTGRLSRVALALLLTLPPAAAWAGAPIQLPAPLRGGGAPLMEALAQRHSSREFAPTKLSPQLVSNLLWAAAGINRPESGGRTVPSAMNWQEIDIYLATADGLFLYRPAEQQLEQVADRDIRALTGQQPFVAEAPLNLVFVADYGRMGEARAEEKPFYAAIDTGYISQNVYLFCAAEGLATVARASLDGQALAKAMGLRPEQRVVLAQSVGYPRGEAVKPVATPVRKPAPKPAAEAPAESGGNEGKPKFTIAPAVDY
ncbi:hypothetical protein GURASL_27410 [Geotalea uraniireducens]|uniref:Nitroreductase domain-containing protein n=1 Tax=Geotalea uraniireducens TaxID=351604 RepID=A0ABM8EMZ7_9BACT|nr:SagB/ThcOx family dehydrogenase [Geotalea uraniireducens]BDV43818.1 hypothetical protein GURASL_27410 [Geotalea uraniireducens]